MKEFVFRLYEDRRLRLIYYGVSFGVVVPTGGRMAYMLFMGQTASVVDKVLMVVAGATILTMFLVTMLRIWYVDPVQTQDIYRRDMPVMPNLNNPQFWNAVDRRNAENAHASKLGIKTSK